jgi:stearoyl-CoA desaturase (Delta-9 desaturase)
MSAGKTPVGYNGTRSFPASPTPPQTPAQRATQLAVTTVLVAGPFAGLAVAVWLLWGHGVGFADIGLAVFFYLLTGFGVTVGLHRCLTHRSFTARPALPVALAVAGSLASRAR